MSIALVIPTLNPDERLSILVQEVRVLLPSMNIIVVDDGSAPAFAFRLDKLKHTHKCLIARHPERYGRGAAIKTGIGHLLRHQQGVTGFVVAEAAETTQGPDIQSIHDALAQHPEHLIIRTEKPERKRVFRKCGTQAAFMGIPAQYAQWALDVRGERFEYETNLILWAEEEKIPVLQIPGASPCPGMYDAVDFRPIQDSLRIGWAVLRHRTGRLFHRRKTRRSTGADLPNEVQQEPVKEQATV